jgi:hypothetical protein
MKARHGGCNAACSNTETVSLLTQPSEDGERHLGWYGIGHRIAMDIARGLHFLHSLKARSVNWRTSRMLISKAKATPDRLRSERLRVAHVELVRVQQFFPMNYCIFMHRGSSAVFQQQRPVGS